MSQHGIFASGMARSYQAGARHIRQINADVARVAFVKRLLDHPNRTEFNLTEPETDFLIRIERDHDRAVPNLHSGDRNICDSIRRKYQARVNAQGGSSC